ncbi:MAG: RnfABCDGE type electron transport complex subunit D [Clostridia bacterium]|nr:RnfABCDGE type electron transport complex subunit D [Clostridia bacterium]
MSEDNRQTSGGAQGLPAAETGGGSKAGVKIPELLTVSPPPHIKHTDTTASIMLDVIIALLPAAAWGVYVFGPRALAIMLISTGSAVLFEFLSRLLFRKKCSVGDLSAVVTGLLLGMNLPSSVSYWIPVVGAFFAIVIVKQLFGGIGKNFLNPALAGRAFLFAWPKEMTSFPEVFERLDWKTVSFAQELDSIATATPLASLKAGEVPQVSTLDLFLGKCGGSIGEVSAALLLLGGIYLLLRKVITWHIPVSFICTVALLTALFPAGGGMLKSMTSELLSGGLMLGAIFMATDYSTSPVTGKGRLIFGAGCGAVTVFIRYFGGYNEGVSFAILIMNMLVYYIDRLTRPRIFGTGGRNTTDAEKEKAAK